MCNIDVMFMILMSPHDDVHDVASGAVAAFDDVGQSTNDVIVDRSVVATLDVEPGEHLGQHGATHVDVGVERDRLGDEGERREDLVVGRRLRDGVAQDIEELSDALFAVQAHAEVDELARHLLAHARVLHRVDGVEDDGDAAASHVSVAVRHDGHHDEVLDVIADVALLAHSVLEQRQNDATTLLLAL